MSLELETTSGTDDTLAAASHAVPRSSDVDRFNRMADSVLAGKALSLVHPWTLHRRVADTAMAIWSTCAGAELWETQDILVAVEYCSFPDDKVGTLLPKRYRA